MSGSRARRERKRARRELGRAFKQQQVIPGAPAVGEAVVARAGLASAFAAASPETMPENTEREDPRHDMGQ